MLKRRVWIPIASTVFALALIAAVLFLYSLLKVNLLITEYLLLVIAVLVLFLYITGVLLFYGLRKKRSPRRRARRIIGLVLAVLLVVFCVYGAILFFRVDQTKNSIIANPDAQMRASLGVYVKQDDPAESLSDMAGYTFAVLGELGDEKINSNYVIGEINNRLYTNVKTVSYPGVTDAAAALQDDSVQALVVNKYFLALLNDTESLADFAETLRLVDEIQVPNTATLENTPIVIKTAGGTQSDPSVTPAPTPVPTPSPTPAPVYGEDRTLVFYLSGVDDWVASSTHSDVNLLMLVNTKTRQILVINTPRDFFVTNPALGGGDKLTHCGIQGISNSIAALENFYGISVDNYVKVNFDGFESFIDAIGGITVENPVRFTAAGTGYGYVYEVGTLELDGSQALCYARAREDFGDGELGRDRSQLRVMEAIVDKVKSSGASLLMDYPSILSAMGDSFETDLTSQQMSDLVKIATRYLSDWEFRSYAVIGDSGMRVTASGGSQPLYIIWPRQYSVDFAVKLMNKIQNNELITDEDFA